MCLRKVDYALKDVTDEPEKKYDEINELSKKDYLRLSKSKYKCINVEYAEKDGKYLEIVHMTQYRRWHHEPTKHKLLYWLMSKAQLLQSYFSYPSKTTREQEVVYDALYDIASKLIRNTESECMKTCEVCGSQIGTEWSPICQTAGWIRYICETCAKKGGRYYKDHKLYENGKLVKEASKKNSKKQSKTKE